LPILHRVAWGAGILALVYAAVVVAIRPIYLRWGTTATERVASLRGDQLNPDARHRIDHATTTHAPVDPVWPWLVQLGQDRGGFYSYSRLERMVGDHVQNADRIHPEWQHLQAGDLVRAVQPDYLGGRFGDVGWRVIDVVPGRAMILDKACSCSSQRISSCSAGCCAACAIAPSANRADRRYSLTLT
jgi:hypothetical protein